MESGNSTRGLGPSRSYVDNDSLLKWCTSPPACKYTNKHTVILGRPEGNHPAHNSQQHGPSPRAKRVHREPEQNPGHSTTETCSSGKAGRKSTPQGKCVGVGNCAGARLKPPLQEQGQGQGFYSSLETPSLTPSMSSFLLGKSF